MAPPALYMSHEPRGIRDEVALGLNLDGPAERAEEARNPNANHQGRQAQKGSLAPPRRSPRQLEEPALSPIADEVGEDDDARDRSDDGREGMKSERRAEITAQKGERGAG